MSIFVSAFSVDVLDWALPKFELIVFQKGKGE